MKTQYVIDPKMFLTEMNRAKRGPTFSVAKDVILYLPNRTLPKLEGVEYKSQLYLGAQWTQLQKTGESENTITVLSGIGVGAPALGLYLEIAIELGAKRIIVLGSAGSLHPSLKNQDIILCDRAFATDGLSRRYQKWESNEYGQISADSELLRCASECLDNRGLSFETGPTWTTDGFFRESVDEVQKFYELGAKTVEMEASAAYAIALERNIQALAAFVISDELHFHPKTLSEGLVETNIQNLSPVIWRPNYQKLSVRYSLLMAVAIETLTR